MKSIIAGIPLAVICFWLSLPGVALSEDPVTGGKQPQTPREKIVLLEKTIHDLEDVNAMFMENLANCMEENETLLKELKERAVAGQEDAAGPTGQKERLIREIRMALGTDMALPFLNQLTEGQLGVLLEAIEEGAKDGPGHAKGEIGRHHGNHDGRNAQSGAK
jgi:hypothetical protein